MTTTREGGVGWWRDMAVEKVGQMISEGMTASRSSLVTISIKLVDEVTLSLSLPPGSSLSPLPPPPLLVVCTILLREIRHGA